VGIVWTIIIGFVAGVIAEFITPGPNEPSGFILTTILGIVGAFVASWLGHALGWYQPGEGAGLIGAVVGAVIVLVIWGLVTKPGTSSRLSTYLWASLGAGTAALAGITAGASGENLLVPDSDPLSARR